MFYSARLVSHTKQYNDFSDGVFLNTEDVQQIWEVFNSS